MKSFSRTIIKFSVFLSLFLFFGQAVLSQEHHCIEGMFLNEILSKLTTRRTISPEPINKELIVEIPKRKISFELNEADEKILKDAGANELVIKLIRENVLSEAIKLSSLYNTYLENYELKDIEKLKIAVEAAKEFVDRFENKECYLELVNYFKVAIPVLNKTINSATQYKSSTL